jgi:hypothetical protein
MKLVIDRAKWLRGEKGYLLRSTDGKRCCVGIYLSSLGVPDDAMCDLGTAYAVHEKVDLLPAEAKWLVTDEDCIACRLYEENDDRALPESSREDSIALLFAKRGVEVEFVGATK